MGMFDTVVIRCLHCGDRIEKQTKSGQCHMDVHPLGTAPADVLGDLANQQVTCEKCGTVFIVEVRVTAFLRYKEKEDDGDWRG